MRAVRITRLDGPSALEIADVPDPSPAGGQVLIEVAAAGVAFPDLLLTRGLYQLRPDLPFVPGSEVSGLVRSAPAGSGFAVGDRVAAFPVLGGFAELVATDPALVFPLPDGVSFQAGAALPMNYLTCHFALVTRGRLAPGETVLVHGAAGGIGTAATQLATAYGARVIAVVSRIDKAPVARRAGAAEVVLAEGFKDAVLDLTDGRGVDVVVDPVGGDRFTDSLRCLATLGRLLVIGFTGGSIPEVRVNRLLLANLEVVGVGWGSYWQSRRPFLQEQWQALLPLIAAGRLEPPVLASYPLELAAEALLAIDERRAVGKVLLTPR